VPFCRNAVCRSGEIVIGNVFVAVIPPASVTVNCTLNVPAAVAVPHSSASPGVTDESVSPLPPNRTVMPGGRPEAVQANGAVPPFLTEMVRVHGTPSVQSGMGETAGAIEGRLAGVPTTSIDIVLV